MKGKTRPAGAIVLAACLLSSVVAFAAQPGDAVAMMPPRRPADLPSSPPPAPAPAPTSPATDDPAQKPSEPQKAGPPETPAAPQSDSACLAALIAAHGADVRAAKIPTGQDAACAVVEPVTVEAMTIGVDTEKRRVVFQPPVTLACAMATLVSGWLQTSAQPLAKGYFGRDLASLRVGGGHECRRRNRSANGPLSEHSTGRALDVFAFVVGDGKGDGTIVVEKPDGPRQQNFMTAIRQSACGAFMTSLGPGSDAAHANHLHVDIQQRRAASSRFCQ